MIHERNPRHFQARHYDATRARDIRNFEKHGIKAKTMLWLSDEVMYNIPQYSDSIYTKRELMRMTHSLARVAARIESIGDRLGLLAPHQPLRPSQN